MKKIVYILFLLLLFSNHFFAQNYTLGTFVDDSISSTTIYSYGDCYPNSTEISLTFPISSISGVDHILICTNITGSNNIYNESGDTLNIGDTLLFNQTQNTYKLYSTSIWSVDFTAKTYGTPLIANETYKCGLAFWYDGLSNCDNFHTYHFENNNLCFVADTIILDTVPEISIESAFLYKINEDFSEIKFYPNPVNDKLTIKNNLKNPITEIKIYNILGKLESVSFEKGKEINIDMSGLTNGVYIVEIYSEAKMVRKKVVKEK